MSTPTEERTDPLALRDIPPEPQVDSLAAAPAAPLPEARRGPLAMRSERRAARIRRRAARRASREEWASRIPPIAFGGFPRL